MSHVDGQLLAFHFAALEEHERAAVEAHLRGCSACVAAFLDAKRNVEVSEGSERPSHEVRGRLRRAVQAEVAPPRARWERPVAWVVAAALVLFAATLVGRLSLGEPSPPGGSAQFRW
jgi:hypothetical protein